MDKDVFRLAVEDVREEMDSFPIQGTKEKISEAGTRAHVGDPVIALDLMPIGTYLPSASGTGSR